MALTANRTCSLAVKGDTLDADISASQRYTAGTAAEQVDMRIPFSLRVNNAAVTLDLAQAGITFAKVREIHVKNLNTATGEYVEVGGGTNDVAGYGKRTIGPKGIDVWASPVDGLAVVATTGDTLTFDTTGSGEDVTVEGIVIGTSA